MSAEIKRYNLYKRLPVMCVAPQGVWVKHEDHAAIVAELHADITALINGLGTRKFLSIPVVTLPQELPK